MDRILHNKHILILVSGSIAIYKTLDLISTLKKEGAKIAVVMSENAKNFITPLSFEALSGREVLHSGSEKFLQDSPNHISYASWADIAVLAPASVNTIAKLRYGIADNLLLSTLLATKAQTIIAPSANINMIESKQNIENLAALESIGYVIAPPRVSLLACNITAKGAMAEVDELVFIIKRTLFKQSFWSGRNVVITGGGSIEQIDMVRNISNNSSGKQASTLALAFYYLGANVKLISSRFPLKLPLDIEQVEVKSTESFYDALKVSKRDSMLIMAAAISDYKPLKKLDSKLKKCDIGEYWDLKLEQNTDILSNVDFNIKIGFKAESDKNIAIDNAKALLKSRNSYGKGCDFVILNIISENEIGGDSNEVMILHNDICHIIPKCDKASLSIKIALYLSEIISNAK